MDNLIDRKMLLPAALIVILLCMICSIFIQLVDQTTGKEATSTAVIVQLTLAAGKTAAVQLTKFAQQPTSTLTPTGTPILTDTHTPTFTPVPTSTFTPEPTVDPAVMQYIDEQWPKMVECARLMNEISRLNMRAAEDPTLLLDADWVAEVTIVFNKVEICMYSLGSTTSPVPDILAETHAKLQKIGPQMTEAKEDYLYGLEYLDVESLSKSVDHMKRVNTLIREATKALGK